MSMPMSDRARLGGQAKAANRQPLRERCLAALAEGHCLKRAAYMAGVSVRSARRYRAEAR
jgi:hypothetical protein